MASVCIALKHQRIINLLFSLIMARYVTSLDSSNHSPSWLNIAMPTHHMTSECDVCCLLGFVSDSLGCIIVVMSQFSSCRMVFDLASTFKSCL